MRTLVRDGNRLYFEDDRPAGKPSTVFPLVNVINPVRAQRGVLRATGPNGERMPGGIREAIVCDPDMTCREAERGLVDAAEREGIPRNDQNFVIEEAGTGTIRQRIVRERESRGLVSYPGRAARKQRPKGKGKQAP